MTDPMTSSPTIEPIRGNVVLELRDVLAYLLIFLPKFVAIVIGVSTIVMPAVGFLAMTDRESARFWVAPGTAAWAFFAEVAPIAILFALGAALFIALVQTIVFWRMPMANRILSFEIDQDFLVTRDQMGAEFRMPWTLCRRIWIRMGLVLMKFYAGRVRYFPLRAISDADRQRTIDLVMTRLAKRS